ncbi:MAG: menaquinone-dependent protoporphyrinogen IX dehydrogenase [Gammaproteobacteria bacterium]|nr:menaquinone-dependent protoporphyrinogen IX dehydrogenase [Gammaproteobacteria bacterium]
MANILIVYGTTEGQTAKIAQHIGARLEQQGHEATSMLASDAMEMDLAGYDPVVVGASVHEGRYQKDVRQFVEAHQATLEPRRTAFFSVSLGAVSADPQERAEVDKLMQEFCSSCGWTPSLTRSFAGALRYTQYSWLKRQVMRHIVAKEGGPTDTTQDFEFTDWDDVSRFAEELVDS